jgi:NNP family nitrate/nitrite transporter-like MFS transporter
MRAPSNEVASTALLRDGTLWVMSKACPTPRPFNAVAGSVIFLTLLFFVSFVSRFIFSPLFPAIGKDIPLKPGQAGTLFLLGAVGALIGSFVAGLVSSRLNHRGSILIAVFGAAAALVAAHFAGSIWVLGACLIALGFFAGIHTPSSVATITAIVRPADWGKALSIQQLGPPLSLVIGPLLAVGLLKWFSWQTTLLWVAGLCALLGLVFLAFRGLGSFPGDAPSPALLKPVVRIRSFWVMIFLFALGMGAQVGVYTMLPLYLTTQRGMSAGSANTILGLANISPLLMAFVSGWVTDRIGEKRTMTLFLFLAGLSTVMVGSMSGTAMKVSIFLMAAFAVGFFPPAFKALSRIVQPTFRSLAAGFAPPVAFLLGGGLLPAALGYMGQAYTFGLGITIIGVIITVGSLATFFLKLLTDLGEGC